MVRIPHQRPSLLAIPLMCALLGIFVPNGIAQDIRSSGSSYIWPTFEGDNEGAEVQPVPAHIQRYIDESARQLKRRLATIRVSGMSAQAKSKMEADLMARPFYGVLHIDERPQVGQMGVLPAGVEAVAYRIGGEFDMQIELSWKNVRFGNRHHRLVWLHGRSTVGLSEGSKIAMTGVYQVVGATMPQTTSAESLPFGQEKIAVFEPKDISRFMDQMVVQKKIVADENRTKRQIWILQTEHINHVRNKDADNWKKREQELLGQLEEKSKKVKNLIDNSKLLTERMINLNNRLQNLRNAADADGMAAEWLLIAEKGRRRGWPEIERRGLEQILQYYPNSSAAEKAKEHLQRIGRHGTTLRR